MWLTPNYAWKKKYSENGIILKNTVIWSYRPALIQNIFETEQTLCVPATQKHGRLLSESLISDLFVLILCSVDMEGTYAEYSDWADDGVPETVTHLYRRALQQLEKCKPLEEALVTAHLSHCCVDHLILWVDLMRNYVSGSSCGGKDGDCDLKMFSSLLAAKISLHKWHLEHLSELNVS